MASPVRTPHFTAQLVVTRTIPESRVFKDSYDKQGTAEPREVDELARVVLRGEHLPTLLADVQAHIKLMVVE